jgi:hypothetical protein
VFERNIKAIRLPDLAVGPDPTSSLAQLAEFGNRLVSFLIRPEIVRTASVMAACADENPRLAAAFYAAGPGTMLKKVAGFLKSLAKRGVLSIDDPELAAEQLIVSWLGLSQLRQNLGAAGPHRQTQSRGACATRPTLCCAHGRRLVWLAAKQAQRIAWYRERAADCRELAKTAPDERSRAVLEDMATKWNGSRPLRRAGNRLKAAADLANWADRAGCGSCAARRGHGDRLNFAKRGVHQPSVRTGCRLLQARAGRRERRRRSRPCGE